MDFDISSHPLPLSLSTRSTQSQSNESEKWKEGEEGEDEDPSSSLMYEETSSNSSRLNFLDSKSTFSNSLPPFPFFQETSSNSPPINYFKEGPFASSLPPQLSSQPPFSSPFQSSTSTTQPVQRPSTIRTSAPSSHFSSNVPASKSPFPSPLPFIPLRSNFPPILSHQLLKTEDFNHERIVESIRVEQGLVPPTFPPSVLPSTSPPLHQGNVFWISCSFPPRPFYSPPVSHWSLTRKAWHS